TAGFPSPWLARPRCAPVERSCSGGAVAGVLVDSLTLERGPSSGHGEESPWGQRGGMSFLGAGRGHAARPRRRLPTRSTFTRSPARPAVSWHGRRTPGI